MLYMLEHVPVAYPSIHSYMGNPIILIKAKTPGLKMVTLLVVIQLHCKNYLFFVLSRGYVN